MVHIIVIIGISILFFACLKLFHSIFSSSQFLTESETEHQQGSGRRAPTKKLRDKKITTIINLHKHFVT